MAASLHPQEREALLQQFERLSSNGPQNLLTRKRFSDLAALECEQGGVVSLYVDLSPQNRHNQAWAIGVKSQVRDLLSSLGQGKLRETVQGETDRMERWLADHAASMGRGAALFSCPSTSMWWQLALPVTLPTRARVGRRPYLRPLARVRDEHDRFAVVVLDKQRARLFVSQLGHIQEVADIFEDIPGHHKQGGWSQMRFQRHHDSRVIWHAGAVAHATELLMEQFEVRHLLASGTPEVLAEYRSHLSPRVAGYWAGEFGLDIEAPVAEVAEAIAPLQKKRESEEELALIESLNNSLSSGKGVWGLEKTLAAAQERRIRTLIVHDRYRAPGRECRGCHLLFSDPGDTCPACSGPLEGVEDVVDALLEQAVNQEAALELVRSTEARRRLPPGEPIGAILRF